MTPIRDLTHAVGRKAQLFYCHDCGRRFFSKGWHAEACGSSNYSAVSGEPPAKEEK